MTRQYVQLAMSLLLLTANAYAQIKSDSLYSASLKSNLLGEPAKREVLVYLPQEYHSSPDKKYPAIYLLHAYGSNPSSWLGENGYENLNIAVALDSLIANGVIAPVIVVMPDCSTKFGGSWYANSTTGGNWLDFVATDLVNYIDRKFRTRTDRNARGIAGQSMGAYGALLIAMTRPDVFGSVLAMSAPNLDNPDPFGEPAHKAALEIDEGNVASAHILGRLFWSKAIAFSPNPEAPPFFSELPIKNQNDQIIRDQSVWQKWLDYALLNRIDEHVAALKKFHIRIEVGNKDPLIKDSQKFSEKLHDFGIKHELVIFEGGHVKGVSKQFKTSVFKFFDERFKRF